MVSVVYVYVYMYMWGCYYGVNTYYTITTTAITTTVQVVML